MRTRFLVIALLPAVGCTRSDKARPAPVETAAAPAQKTTQPAVNPLPPGTRVPSFKREIAPWLQMRCASAKHCHGEQPNENIDLDLRPEHSFDQLVGQSSEERFGAKRVQPGDPDASYLVAKLDGKLREREGKPMPLDPQTGAPPATVPDDPDFLRNALEIWIRAGAPRN